MLDLKGASKSASFISISTIDFTLAIFKTGNGERGTGNGERGTGNGERGTGNGERGTGNGERGTGNGERGTGNGERGTGNGERYIFAAICFMSTLQLYHLLGNTCLSQAFPFNSFTHTISFRLQMK